MRKSLVAVALVAGLGGCNGDKTSPTASESPAAIPTRAEGAIAEVGVTVSPIKVPATATGDPNFPWQISWVTTVKETAGVAARVDRILTFLVYDKITYAGPNQPDPGLRPPQRRQGRGGQRHRGADRRQGQPDPGDGTARDRVEVAAPGRPRREVDTRVPC